MSSLEHGCLLEACCQTRLQCLQVSVHSCGQPSMSQRWPPCVDTSWAITHQARSCISRMEAGSCVPCCEPMQPPTRPSKPCQASFTWGLFCPQLVVTNSKHSIANTLQALLSTMYTEIAKLWHPKHPGSVLEVCVQVGCRRQRCCCGLSAQCMVDRA